MTLIQNKFLYQLKRENPLTKRDYMPIEKIDSFIIYYYYSHICNHGYAVIFTKENYFTYIFQTLLNVVCIRIYASYLYTFERLTQSLRA